MRILFIIDSLVPAGAERSITALLPGLTSRGVAADVAYLHELPGLQAELRSGGANLFCLEGGHGRAGWVRRARRLIAERRPDLVHTTLFEADIAGRIAARSVGVPVVSSLVGFSYGPEHLGDPSLKRWKVRAAQLLDIATARAVIRFHATSIPLADAMARNLRVPRERIDVVPRARDPKELGVRSPERSAHARAVLGVGDSELVIMAVSRHVRAKGLDVLIEAFARVAERAPEARLFIVGNEGSATPTIREAVHRLGLERSVRILGSRSDVADLLCGTDVFVFPSRSEGFGGALIEAMALQAPIVASDIPALREVLGSEEVAILATSEQPASFASAIVRTIADPLGASERASRARARFLARYTIDLVADQMLRFYQRSVEEARRKRSGHADRGDPVPSR